MVDRRPATIDPEIRIYTVDWWMIDKLRLIVTNSICCRGAKVNLAGLADAQTMEYILHTFKQILITFPFPWKVETMVITRETRIKKVWRK